VAAVTEIRERRVRTNGIELVVTEAGHRGDPVVVLSHGFPECAHSWRHQLAPLAAAGYHVLAPDQRGYGHSSRPTDVAAYHADELSADLLGLLDHVGADDAVFVGHDWGALLVWHMARIHPERMRAVVAVSVPYTPWPAPPTELMRAMWGDRFFYILYFQEQGPADAELDRDPATTFRRLFTMAAGTASAEPGAAGFLDRIPDPGGLPDWISQADFDVYVDEFTRGGFTAPLNWYRCFDRNWELTADPPAATIAVPALFVGGSEDPTLAYTPRHRVREVVSGDYREVMIDGAGHWLTEERPDDVSRVLLEFLTSLR
jgi:pimeloyl-ACP methyl ester carboxylesterase